MSSENDSPVKLSSRTLSDWQQIAEAHFLSLFESRKELRLSTFALEHCYTPTQLQILFPKLLQDFKVHGVHHSYWLLWVIYSTELGYEYIGDEYWQSFIETIPDWTNQNREDIRTIFKKFQTKFSGISPSGTWAAHFSIIAWPITHAILPKDLHRSFAKLLFSNRHKFRSISLSDPASVGEILATNSYDDTSSRFQNLLQQKELIGRIALSLLEDTTDDSKISWINSKTLDRIRVDLEKENRSKQWLVTARSELKPRFLGLDSTSSQNTKTASIDTTETVYKKEFRLKSKLTVHQISRDKWAVRVGFSATGDMDTSTEITSFIKSTRISVEGAKPNWLPGQALFQGLSLRTLIRWPGNTSLIKFETTPPPGLTEKISCGLTPGPWLFALGEDGTAVEIEGKIIRPGRNYIILAENDELPIQKTASKLNIDCENIYGMLVSIPEFLTKEEVDGFLAIGLPLVRTIKIWPVGLSARSWDGEGRCEWLTTETPFFGFSCDFELKRFIITLGDYSLEVPGKTPGTPTFIKIPELQVGTHILKISTQEAITDKSTQGILTIEVRDPVVTTPDNMVSDGFYTLLEPNDDDLDNFISGKTQLKIIGPRNKTISVNFDFYAAGQLLDPPIVRSFTLPLKYGDLKELCTKSLKDVMLANARRLVVRISGDQLGQLTVTLYRNVDPLRWHVRKEKGAHQIRLVDEIENPNPLKLSFYNFETPEYHQNLVLENNIFNIDPNSQHGLLLAEKNKYSKGILIAKQKKPTLSDLALNPVLGKGDPANILSYINLLKIWFDAESLDFISLQYKQKVLDRLIHKLYTYFCGQDWANAEEQSCDWPYEKTAIYLAKLVRGEVTPLMQSRLSHKQPSSFDPLSEYKWLENLLLRHKICPNRQLIEFVFTLASNPFKFIDTNEQSFSEQLKQVLHYQTLFRSIRYYLLIFSKYIDPEKTYPLIQPLVWN